MALLMLFALVAGAGTALSPCVLPILPAVLSAGVTGGRRRPLGVVAGLAVSFTFATVALVYVIEALGLPNDIARTLAIVTLVAFGLVLLVRPLADRVEGWISRVVPGPARVRGDGLASGLLVGASLGFVYALILGGRRITGRIDAYRGRVQAAMGVVMLAVAVVMIANLDVEFENSIARHLPSALVDPASRIEASPGVYSELARLRGGGPVTKEGGAAEAAAAKRLPVLFDAHD